MQCPIYLSRRYMRDLEVVALWDALASELALGGNAASETFGYSIVQLERSPVYLVGARIGRPWWDSAAWSCKRAHRRGA